MAKPNYILLAAMTLDGRIALNSKHLTDWTSPEDKQHMKKILDKCEAIIVGRKTYETAKAALRKRNCLVLSAKKKGAAYLNPAQTDLKKFILKNKYQNICVLGGTKTFNYALKNKMADEIYLTIEPLVFGRGLNLFELPLKKFPKYGLISHKKLNTGGTLLLHCKKINN